MAVPLPDRVAVVVVGAGFAGAATAWALSRSAFGPGLVLEQEESYGFHASGRNAAILRLVESDPVIRTSRHAPPATSGISTARPSRCLAFRAA